MKRSRTIRLLLLGGMSAGALAGCKPADVRKAPITQNNVYTNDYFVPGVGYYHAPFRAWYPLRYNYYDPQQHRYFFGGQWADAPHQSIINISSPTQEAAEMAEVRRSDISRGGFGGIAHGHYFGHSHWIGA